MIMYRESAKINEVIDRIMSEQEPMEMMVTNNSSGHSSRSSSVDSIISNDSNITSSESSNDLNYCNMNKHYLWSITSAEDVALIRLAFESIPSMYIADGHHRTAAACKTFAMNEISENDPNRYLTSLIYPANQLNVLSFNRCVQLPRELFDKEEFFAKVCEI